MSTVWNLTMKPSFLAEWQALPPKEARQIADKLTALTGDPTPDGKQKKRLQNLDGRLCRIRSGDYRIFYTFEQPYVSVLSVRKRDEKTYDNDLEGESLGGPARLDEVPASLESSPSPKPTWSEQIDLPTKKATAKTPLPTILDESFLKRMGVPETLFPKLVGIATEDDLLNCVGVPDEILLRIDQALVARPIEEIAQQPDLIARDVDDLMKFKEGELLGFLLRLDVTQEKFVNWGLKAVGPTLLKGSPGTGKSTVALYRAKAMIDALRKAGVTTPRLLFTTYTHALVKFSEQLLESLLGDDARLVDVRTADSVVMGIARPAGTNYAMVDHERLRAIYAQAVQKAAFTGNSLQVRAQVQTVERLGADYVIEEINSVIDARRLRTIDDYLAAKRSGRDVSLNKTQREAVWQVREALHARLKAQSLHTWEQVRAIAAERVEKNEGIERYDAVIVDEAQDLQPSVLQVLTGLCREPNRLFFTADANQSIYGAGFRWNEIHENLRFQGRTGVLKANYRSTRELGEAAHDYLAKGELDDERADRTYVNNGPTPAVRAVAKIDDETKLLDRFLRTASKELRLGLGAAAVLVPTERAGQRIAEALRERSIPATYMPGKDLDLKSKGVKVITLKSAKGLEFPIVAVAGFLDGGYPPLKPGLADEEIAEILGRERRTMFVAMTRGMRALLVVVPEKTASPLLGGFDPSKWNLTTAG